MLARCGREDLIPQTLADIQISADAKRDTLRATLIKLGREDLIPNLVSNIQTSVDTKPDNLPATLTRIPSREDLIPRLKTRKEK
jgi:hypothetical protein